MATNSVASLTLLPRPCTLDFSGGSIPLPDNKLIAIATPELLFTAQRLQATLARRGLHWEIDLDSSALPADQIGARLIVHASEDAITSDKNVYQEYSLAISSGQVLPVLRITDKPDFVRRGVMLDISRDKVPTMDTLYALVDRLADWKINE